MEAEGIISPVLHADCDYKKTTTFADEVMIKEKEPQACPTDSWFFFFSTLPVPEQ